MRVNSASRTASLVVALPFLALSSLVLAKPCFAQTAPTGLARLEAAARETTLNDDSQSPFYLKIDVQLYDAKGSPSEKATAEEWWAQGRVEKRVYTSSAGRFSEVRRPGEILRSAGPPYPPDLLEVMVLQVVHAIPLYESDGKAPRTHVLGFGKVPLDCLTYPGTSPNAPVDYCFEPGKDSLRLTVEYGTRAIIRNSIGKFGDKYVPLDIAVKDGDRMLATGHVSALTHRTVTPDEVSIDGLTQRLASSDVSSRDHVVAGKLATLVQPVYPSRAKQERRQGVVALRAIVGTDGHVRDIGVISSPGSDFSEAAVKAIGQWVYTPYVVNGEAQPIETTVSVSFTFD